MYSVIRQSAFNFVLFHPYDLVKGGKPDIKRCVKKSAIFHNYRYFIAVCGGGTLKLVVKF